LAETAHGAAALFLFLFLILLISGWIREGTISPAVTPLEMTMVDSLRFSG